MITLEQLHQIIPYAGHRAGIFLPALNSAMDEFGIDTPARQAAFISQVAHESGSLRYVSEIASGRAYNDRTDLGNTKPEAIRIAAMNGTMPGVFWKGRGLIQITGFDNHAACSKALGIGCVNNPKMLEMPIYAARSAAWFWSSHGLNELADAGNFEKITRRINGGLNGLADRMAFYERAKSALLGLLIWPA